jgi:sigma-B regulation protein RsbU (phosphoserine phosphatase)
MRILVAWDDAKEAELLALYLAADGNDVIGAATPDALLNAIHQGSWDAVVLSLTYPASADEGFALFQQVQQQLPAVPVVLGYRPTEMFNLPRFLTHGLRFHLMRDAQGDFIFVMLSCVISAVEATRAEESRKLAQRLREEMDGVRRLQEAIIPRELQPPPGYRIAARYEPSQVSVLGDVPVVMAGGDYYDLLRPDEQTLVVLLGDASGHGLKACMSIMTMHTLVRMIPGERYRDTAGFVSEINQRLCENSIVQSGGGFITLLYAAIDTVTHTMSWSSAGHPLPLLHDLKTDEVVQIGTSADGGLPLGIDAGASYSAATITLPPESRLLLYTDGLTDAFSAKGNGHQAFGVHGIRETLRACRQGELEETLQQLLGASSAFTDGVGRHDDTSAVLLERSVAPTVRTGSSPKSQGRAAAKESSNDLLTHRLHNEVTVNGN